MGEHNVEPVKNRDGDVVGAPIFLSPDELEELEKTGSVEITQK